tara:strand:- start:237 stop:410 length:174 start_codon:yes stop_codon:yes gene_type:complete
MHCDLDALDDFLEKKDPIIEVPLEDMTAILTQLWKSRATEPKIGEIYEKYKALIPEK